jgi:hypothetical protein
VPFVNPGLRVPTNLISFPKFLKKKKETCKASKRPYSLTQEGEGYQRVSTLTNITCSSLFPPPPKGETKKTKGNGQGKKEHYQT